MTCSDTLAQSHNARDPGAVAAMAEEKEVKYTTSLEHFSFAPVAIETLGAIGPKSLAFLKDLGRKIKHHTGEEQAHHFFAPAVISGCTAGESLAVMGAAGGSSSLDNPFLD